jgi:hypothetical protein
VDRGRAAPQGEQVAALLARNPAAHVPLGAELLGLGVGELLRNLREAGARKQAGALLGQLPAAGMFGLFLFERLVPADQFRFGREADGTPAAPWSWEDLDLWLVPRLRGQAVPAQHLAGRPPVPEIRNTEPSPRRWCRLPRMATT